jgi:hypothetical protein
MGISASAVFGRCSRIAALGRESEGDEAGRSIAMGRTGVTRRKTKGESALECGTRASLVIAGREPAKERPAFLSGSDFDHDVSILITAVEVAGR